MKAKPTEPLRGEAAYRAQKREIERRNEAAQAAAMRRRSEKDAKAIAEAAQRDRSEMRELRSRPGE